MTKKDIDRGAADSAALHDTIASQAQMIADLERRLSSFDGGDGTHPPATDYQGDRLRVDMARIENYRAVRIGCRCEVRLQRVDDIYAIDSLVRGLVDRRETYLDMRDTKRMIQKPIHALMWLIQHLEFSGQADDS